MGWTTLHSPLCDERSDTLRAIFFFIPVCRVMVWGKFNRFSNRAGSRHGDAPVARSAVPSAGVAFSHYGEVNIPENGEEGSTRPEE